MTTFHFEINSMLLSISEINPEDILARICFGDSIACVTYSNWMRSGLRAIV